MARPSSASPHVERETIPEFELPASPRGAGANPGAHRGRAAPPVRPRARTVPYQELLRPSLPRGNEVPRLLEEVNPGSANTRARRATPIDRRQDARPAGHGVVAKDRCLLTVLSGERTGEIFRVAADGLEVGRGAEAEARFDDPFLSRLHARLSWLAGGVHLEDLGSTNGTYLGDERVVGPRRLCDGDHILLGKATILRCSMHDAWSEQSTLALYAASIEDPVTGAHNRRHLETCLASALSFARSSRTELSLLLFDVDDFKRANDVYGHAAGDGILRVVVAAVRRLMRPDDLLARYGGDEFVVLLRGVSAANACVLGERIRRAVEALPLRAAGEDVHATVTVGIASWKAPAELGPETLLEVADRALYRGKTAGRNRVVAAVID